MKLNIKIEKEDIKIKAVCLIQLAAAIWYIWHVLKNEVSVSSGAGNKKGRKK